MRAGAGKFVLFVLAAAATEAQVLDRPVVLPPAEVDELDAKARAYLENATHLLAEHQWAEAVEAIREAGETQPSRLVKVEMPRSALGFERYVTASQYCQWRLTALGREAPAALAHYRQLIEPLAERWLRHGVQNNDAAALQRIVDEAFASRECAAALLKLGDLALSQGRYAQSRGLWQQISPVATIPTAAAPMLHSPAGSPLWPALKDFDFKSGGPQLKTVLLSHEPARLGICADSDIPPAAVLARLALTSIMEDSIERAHAELALLRLLFPEASGHLAGRDGPYVDLLSQLLDESTSWPPQKQSRDWLTFAGDCRRGQEARGQEAIAKMGELLAPLWSYALPRVTADRDMIGTGRLRVAEDGKALLSYHPVVVGQTVLVRFDADGRFFVVALDLTTGRELWRAEHGAAVPRGSLDEAAPDARLKNDPAFAAISRELGVARYSQTVFENKLFVRMGSPVTSPTARHILLGLTRDRGVLMGLDLQMQGKPLEGFPLQPPTNEWAFEGPPLSDGAAIYVAMRRTETTRSSLYVAAYDLQTTPTMASEGDSASTGRLSWRTRISSSSLLGSGEANEITHLLLTCDAGQLYLNSSAGSVAALRREDGRLLWLVKYPRLGIDRRDPDRREQRLFRDLTPCLAWKDLLIVAPQDCERIFALDSQTGELAWTLPAGGADDAIHLLGVAEDTLIASGNSLYWIDVNQGRILAQFPPGKLGGEEQASPSPRGYGRGLIARDTVCWPTRDAIYVFAARPALTDFGWQPRLIRKLALPALSLTGGNLVIAGDVLLVAGGDKLVAYTAKE